MNNTLQAAYSQQIAVRTDFDVLAAVDIGVLGNREALVTSSGVETVACCSSCVAMG